jgi:hypothetical protein
VRAAALRGRALDEALLHERIQAHRGDAAPRHRRHDQKVADVLRHRCIDTTAICAKVDLTGLRSVALPWPGGTP